MGIEGDVITEFELKATEAVDALKGALGRIRTGRANLSVLDPIRVDYYGTKSPLNQVATLAVPDPRLITVKPFDKSLLSDIEKALRASSDLGLSPQNDGEKILLPIPPLTEERRKEFTKLAKGKGEDAKIAIRNGRREANDALKKAEKDGDVPEDDAKKAVEKVQTLTDKFVKSVEDLVAKKEKEILEI
ncbi:MAG: ribosome recycling factor [Deltaproteobacteria bacterium]|nr:ribosome recycling factor [Deltaproteobacteria bacterium]